MGRANVHRAMDGGVPVENTRIVAVDVGRVLVDVAASVVSLDVSDIAFGFSLLGIRGFVVHWATRDLGLSQT